MKNKNFLLIIFTSVFLSAATTALLMKTVYQPQATTIKQAQPVRFASMYNERPSNDRAPADFTYASKVATPGVVHVTSKSMSTKGAISYNPFQDLFGQQWFFGVPPQNQQPEPSEASGSGVLISPDGYIVTNNHVIKGADEIEVTTSDNKKFKATLVGTDPSTDVALLKIDGSDLPCLAFANSDSLEIGSWVLAVGNPFNLESTVTAGIVSAKGRNINIIEGQSAIESFIQTDAAVNPGNSGGALVDLSGRVVGINTAIASPTGAYAGYSFAVPSNLVSKVVHDLKEYGIVERGYLGVAVRNMDSDLAKDLGAEDITGVYVQEVMDGSAAQEAGIKAKDVVKTINGEEVNSASRLQELVAQYRPNDKIKVEYVHDGKLKEATITLKNKNKSTEYLSKADLDVVEMLGVEFSDVSRKELKDLGINNGVKVNAINDGKIKKYTDMRPGFIITRIDKQPVNSVDDVTRLLANKKGGVMIEGVYPDYPGTYYYAFGM